MGLATVQYLRPLPSLVSHSKSLYQWRRKKNRTQTFQRSHSPTPRRKVSRHHLTFLAWAHHVLAIGALVRTPLCDIHWLHSFSRLWLLRRPKHQMPNMCLLKTPTLIASLQRSASERSFHSGSMLQSDSLNRIGGAWHIFSGDQLGSLFAGRALGLYQASGAPMSK